VQKDINAYERKRTKIQRAEEEKKRLEEEAKIKKTREEQKIKELRTKLTHKILRGIRSVNYASNSSTL